MLGLDKICPIPGDLWIFPKEERIESDLIIKIIEKNNFNDWVVKVIFDDSKTWIINQIFTISKDHNRLFLLERQGRWFFSRKHRKCSLCQI